MARSFNSRAAQRLHSGLAAGYPPRRPSAVRPLPAGRRAGSARWMAASALRRAESARRTQLLSSPRRLCTAERAAAVRRAGSAGRPSGSPSAVQTMRTGQLLAPEPPAAARDLAGLSKDRTRPPKST
jgi:hypothetical protein